MSVITMTNRAARRAVGSNSRTGRNQPAETIQQDDEFQGFWLNIGVQRPDGKFYRLNRGVAVSDLTIRPVYENTDPDRKAELLLMNKIVRAIQGRANHETMAEGEHIVLPNLQVMLYRKMEGADGVDDTEGDDEIENWLFGNETAPAQAQADNEAEEARLEAEIERRVAERLASKRKSAAKAALEDDDLLGTANG